MNRDTLRKIPKHALYRPYRWYLFNRYDHTEAYRRLMKFRIRVFGPDQSVGGTDSGIGKLQFEYLKAEGLEPSDTVLDIGCGTLRGGKHFIKYLDRGNYIGMDISKHAIQSGREQHSDIVSDKLPRFYVNNNLKFGEINTCVDFAIAQSVFTHLPLDMIDECLSNIDTVLSDTGVFYATIFESDTPKILNGKDHYHSLWSIQSLASKHDLSLQAVSQTEYPHPKGQTMLRIEVSE